MTALESDMSLHTALDMGGHRRRIQYGSHCTLCVGYVARYLARQELVGSFYPDKRFIDALIEPQIRKGRRSADEEKVQTSNQPSFGE